jgi:hypothetical protein
MTPKVQRDQYAGMALLYDFGWPLSDIGRLWGIKATQTSKNIRAWKEGRVPDCTLRDDSRRGGFETHKTSMKAAVGDLEEVRAYMERNPGATASDVAMECNMTNNHAGRLIHCLK